ncbi:MAG: hypothetical protein ACYC6Y_04590 [Thermoguttaceae bacterium]
MKEARFVLVAVIALLMAMPVAAQENQGKKKGPSVKVSQVSQVLMNVEKLHKAIEGLDLTAEQQAKLEQLKSENEPKLKEALEKVGAIFTEEQKAAAKAAAEKAKGEKLEGRKFFAAVEAAVKITDEQKTKVEELGKEMATEYRLVMKKALDVLTAEQQETVKKAMAPAPQKKKVQAAK